MEAAHEQGGSIRTHNRTTVTTMVILATLAAVGLTGCSIQGNAAESWLSKSQIIESTDHSMTGCSAMCDPEVEGTIRESATAAEVRRLGEAATDYLSSHGGDEVGMTLEFGKVSFEIGGTQDETSQLMDLALTTFDDDRVSIAYVNRSYVTLYGAKTDVSTLFTEYAGAKDRPLTARADGDDDDKHTNFIIEEGTERCDISEPLIAHFDTFVLDPGVTSLWLGPCTKLEVAVADESGVDAMVEKVQQLASDPRYASMEFSVATEDGSPYAVTADTPQLDPLFALFDATPGVASYSVTDNVILVGVSDPALFRSIVTTIDAAPRPGFITGIRVGHDWASVYINGDGTLAAQISTAEAMFASNGARAEDDKISFSAGSDGTLGFGPVHYDEEAGRQIVDAVVAGGLWKTSSTRIEVFDQPVVFTVTAAAGSETFVATRSNETPETTSAIENLNTYWAAQTGSG